MTGDADPEVIVLVYQGNRDVRQILLIDGPAVLGWDQWRSLQAESPLDRMVLAAGDEASLYRE